MFRYVIALVALVGFASAACDQPTLAGCASSLSSCIMKNPTSPSDICVCRGTYDGCLKDAGCPAATVAAVVKSCESAGCTASQCAPSLNIRAQAYGEAAHEAIVDSVSLAAASCDQAGLSGCASSLSSCIMSDPTSPSAICDCRGTYDRCVKGLGCPAATVAAIVKSCESAGCTASTCSA
eukprot:CAMPEP_0185577180 /NCGR_PEP_ID=MMETSP0434-20130131/9133_1 /TAXON_ID=626734 ORGANISM="Favella taraikaensis, Strain Fe Narragansett Bay" /NCGR_SAMPLE_ID=MMETSP0434 /ASSEMBLY_ACC=CAM_ASM_000379 /LENGTH=179 /DNA_ID=CAMNT_0028194677 /DNA_START=12 /DNA_END=551 /DNA_ORIENTATION=+